MEVINVFLEKHRDRILHLHLSDALPPDHEGLQIGEGSVDIGMVIEAFRGREVTAVPEIMGGHRGGGISFKRALEMLRRIEADLG
jgi:sugar phosphate isomerase/epimerase